MNLMLYFNLMRALKKSFSQPQNKTYYTEVRLEAEKVSLFLLILSAIVTTLTIGGFFYAALSMN